MIIRPDVRQPSRSSIGQDRPIDRTDRRAVRWNRRIARFGNLPANCRASPTFSEGGRFQVQGPVPRLPLWRCGRRHQAGIGRRSVDSFQRAQACAELTGHPASIACPAKTDESSFCRGERVRGRALRRRAARRALTSAVIFVRFAARVPALRRTPGSCDLDEGIRR